MLVKGFLAPQAALKGDHVLAKYQLATMYAQVRRGSRRQHWQLR